MCPSSFFHKFSSLDDFPTNYICKMFDNSFTLKEFVSVVRNSKVRSSPGIDQVNYNIISSLLVEYLEILLDIYNELLDKNLFPPSWHHSLVFLISKNTPGKYHSISLTSCLLKILEKLILIRLNWWIKSSGTLPSTQFGFRKRKSCSDNLGILTIDI